ncbi:MAG: FecR domain-containing protein [Treponema sp.]|nr:FecR domain-containing protein [Treponema sp.]
MNKKSLLILGFILLLSSIAHAQSGVIRELSGEVELKHASSANFAPANVGDEVREDTVISTGFRSSALVEVGNVLFTVRPLTRLTLTEVTVSSDSETVNANLQTGRVRVEVNSPAGLRTSMSVSSPSATASVRGTIIEFDGEFMTTHQGTGMLQGNSGLPVPVGTNFAAGVTNSGKVRNSFYTGPVSSSSTTESGVSGEDSGAVGAVVVDGGEEGSSLLPPSVTGTDNNSGVSVIDPPTTTTPPPPGGSGVPPGGDPTPPDRPGGNRPGGGGNNNNTGNSDLEITIGWG